LEELKKRLKIETADNTRDEQLLDHLLSASRIVENVCNGRRFSLAATASARTFDPAGRTDNPRTGGELLLIDDIGALDDFAVESGDGTTFSPVSSSIYRTWPDGALVRPDEPITGLQHIQSYGWSGASRLFSLVTVRIRITARWGFPRVPQPVREATKIMAQRFYLRKDSPEGVAGSSEWGVIRLANLDPDVRLLLRKYRA
jgi:hypothetical protein